MDTTAERFALNPDYTQQEVDLWLRPRCARLGAESDARAPRRNGGEQMADEADERAAAAAVEEEEGRVALDTRLEAHRTESTFVLSLDAVCEDHDLNRDTRFALLAMTV